MRLSSKWFTSLFFLTTTFSYAGEMGNQPISPCCSREGFYVGAGVGEAFNRYHFKGFNTVTGFEEIFYLRKNKAIGTVFGGYSATAYNGFYLAGEVGTNFPKRRVTFIRQGAQLTSSSFTNHISMQDYVTGDILPGYRINQRFLIYGRIGAAYSRFDVSEDQAINAPAFLHRYNIPSTRLGAGVNVGVTPQISIGLDYIYMGYYPINALFANGFTTIFNAVSHTNYAGLSILYTFC